MMTDDDLVGAMNKDEYELYELIDKAVSVKGEEWFNTWSESNDIDNFRKTISNEELTKILNDPEFTTFCFIDYAAMKEQLRKDMQGH